jgi:hypothetical protein
MSQDRYKGIECDQCGKPSDTGLRLRFMVERIFVKTPKGKHPADDIEFYANFCSKDCMRTFLTKHYFESIWEVVEDNEI